jgi:hypothetical protein
LTQNKKERSEGIERMLGVALISKKDRGGEECKKEYVWWRERIGQLGGAEARRPTDYG